MGMVGLAAALSEAQASESYLVGRPKAKRVIFLFMNGAPSHVDTFDPKPALKKYEGKNPGKAKNKTTGFMPSPFKFAAHGSNGVVMSELFPHLSKLADDLCVLRSMHTDTPNHEPGLLLMHSGNQQPVRPSLGSWVSYGLGTENKNLPSYVAISPGRPVVGPQLWSCGFLPGEHQGLSVDTNQLDVDKLVPHLKHPSIPRGAEDAQLDLLTKLDRIHQKKHAHERSLEAQIRALEVASAMQLEASEAFDLSLESEEVRNDYGRSPFGQSCLLARRLVERGVRFVTAYYVTKSGKQPWDTHNNNDNGHRKLCKDSDQATAALLQDLKQRGLLEDTLVVWGGEFGRTPYSQSNKNKKKMGRDHHNTGFSMFLAGGGTRGGYMHGATDEVGMHAVENRMHVHDLHATILHLLGIDHEKLTYRYSGRDFRLTDIHGRVEPEIIA